jgi:hypothetical protein
MLTYTFPSPTPATLDVSSKCPIKAMLITSIKKQEIYPIRIGTIDFEIPRAICLRVSGFSIGADDTGFLSN